MANLNYVYKVDLEKTGFGYTLKLIGGKYKMLILYTLSLNKRSMRFNALMRTIGNISHKTLANSLQELAEVGLICRTEFVEVPVRVEYSLTDKGQTLLPVMDSICRWGENELKISKKTC